MRIITLIFTFICFCSHAQTEKYISKENGLFTINSSYCPLVFIGPTKYNNTNIRLFDIALTPNGNLWGVAEQKLYSVNKQTGNLTFVCNIPYANTSCLLALNNNELIFDANASPLSLLKINLTTFNITNLGPLDHTPIGDLVFFDNNLYMACFGYLLKINMNSNYTAIQSTQLISAYNPEYQRFVGLMTVTDTDNSNKYMLGFFGHSIYKICPIDGSYELVCNIVMNSQNAFLGATATELSVSNPIQTTCPNLEISDFNKLNSGIIISPNPVKNSDLIKIKLNTIINAPVTINVFNLQGVEIENQTFTVSNNDLIELDLSPISMPEGIYFLEIEVEGEKYNSKLIIH